MFRENAPAIIIITTMFGAIIWGITVGLRTGQRQMWVSLLAIGIFLGVVLFVIPFLLFLSDQVEPKEPKDELLVKAKEKVIGLFGPESMLAQVLEDEDSLAKMEEFLIWYYKEIKRSESKLKRRLKQIERR